MAVETAFETLATALTTSPHARFDILDWLPLDPCVVSSEILATPKLETGSGNWPGQAAKASLERPYLCTLVTLGP